MVHRRSASIISNISLQAVSLLHMALLAAAGGEVRVGDWETMALKKEIHAEKAGRSSCQSMSISLK